MILRRQNLHTNCQECELIILGAVTVRISYRTSSVLLEIALVKIYRLAGQIRNEKKVAE